MKSRNAEPEVMLPLFLPLAAMVQAGGSSDAVAVARAATAVLTSVCLFPPPDGIRIKRTCVCVHQRSVPRLAYVQTADYSRFCCFHQRTL